MKITKKQLAAALTEHERRYRCEPNEFISNTEVVLYLSPAEAGKNGADYLWRILKEQRGG